jgi:hypothetical protein
MGPAITFTTNPKTHVITNAAVEYLAKSSARNNTSGNQKKKRVEKEHANLRAAISWALSVGKAETAARGWALWIFWWYHSHQREGRRWMEAVLERDLSPPSPAKVLLVAGSMAFGHGDYEQNERYCGECLELSEQAGDRLRAAWALRRWAGPITRLPLPSS